MTTPAAPPTTPPSPKPSSTINATLRYLAKREQAAVYMAASPGGDVTPHQGQYRDYPVQIANARVKQSTWQLQKHGFQLVTLPSIIDANSDATSITTTYSQQICDLLQELYQARHVAIFDHTRRTSDEGLRVAEKWRETAKVIHNDYTDSSATTRLQMWLDDQAQPIKDLSSDSMMIINAWRPLNGKVENYAMALCDAASVDDDDLVDVVRQAEDRTGAIQFALHNPAHQWYSFPAQDNDEILLFKTYDSNPKAEARRCLHSAFDDPNAARNCKPRHSIESRCLVFL